MGIYDHVLIIRFVFDQQSLISGESDDSIANLCCRSVQSVLRIIGERRRIIRDYLALVSRRLDDLRRRRQKIARRLLAAGRPAHATWGWLTLRWVWARRTPRIWSARSICCRRLSRVAG